MAAITMCVGDLQKQIEPVARAAKALHKLCDRRRPRTMEEEQRVSHLARQVAESLGRAWGDLSRLLDEPGDDDRPQPELGAQRRPAHDQGEALGEEGQHRDAHHHLGDHDRHVE